MSQADELLNSLTEPITTHEHTIFDPDGRFAVDPDTYRIDYTGYGQVYLMQYSHNSEIFTFEIPRYVENHDMMLCNAVKVHYNNISEDGTENRDTYDVTDLMVDPENPEVVICTWTITRNVTELPGILSFAIQYSCVEDDGSVVYDLFSDIYSDVEVKSSLNNGEVIVEKYADILEQWRAKLFGAGESILSDIAVTGDAQVLAIEKKAEEALSTIPNDCKTREFDLTLVVDNWVESDDKMYYTQAVEFDARPTGKIELHPTPMQLIDLISDGISMFIANESGDVTAYAVGGIPGTDFTVRATETVVIYE